MTIPGIHMLGKGQHVWPGNRGTNDWGKPIQLSDDQKKKQQQFNTDKTKRNKGKKKRTDQKVRERGLRLKNPKARLSFFAII